VLSTQDMSIIEKYLKKNENIDLNYINSSCLSKFKSYSKILGLLYTLDYIKESHIFNDIVLASKSQIIKEFFKSDMVVV